MRRPSPKWLGMIAVVAVIIAGVFIYVRFSPVRVTVLRPENNIAIKVFGLGTVEARVLSKIGFKVAGTLTDLRVDHGDRVSAGQVLALIDNREQQARAAKAKAQLASAQAAVQVSEAAANKAEALLIQRSQTNRRRQSLLERQSASQEAADDAQANEAVARAELLVAKSEIDSARAKLEDARAQQETDRIVLNQHELRAPFDAIVVSRAKELGAVLAAGEALFTLVAPETIWILAYVDESRAGGMEVGHPAEVRLRSLPQQLFHGHVVRIGIESDRVNEERRVYVTCEDCPREFFLGEQAEVFITKSNVASALMVPEAMIERFDGSTGVIWIVDKGRLHRQKVTFGHRSHEGRVEVRDGLPSGASIPTEVTNAFREGRSASVSGGAAE